MKSKEEIEYTQTAANIPDEWFSWKERDKEKLEQVSRPSLSYWQDAWRRLVKNKMAMLGLIFLVLLTIMAIIGQYSHLMR